MGVGWREVIRLWRLGPAGPWLFNLQRVACPMTRYAVLQEKAHHLRFNRRRDGLTPRRPCGLHQAVAEAPQVCSGDDARRNW
jgi:hypothetical protein